MALCEALSGFLANPPNPETEYAALGAEAGLAMLCLVCLYYGKHYLLNIYYCFISLIVGVQLLRAVILLMHYALGGLDRNIWASLFYSLGYLSNRSFVEDVCVFFLVQRSSGRRALSRSWKYAALIFIFDIVMRGFAFYSGTPENVSQILICVNYSAHVLLYLGLVIWMQIVKYKHHIWTKYFIYVLMLCDFVRIVGAAMVIAMDDGACLETLHRYLEALNPCVLTYALYCDSRYWRIFGQNFRTLPRKSIYRATRSSSFLGIQNDSLSEDRKYRRIDDFLSCHVTVLDPIHLKIESKIGRGSSAKIYKGRLSKHLARLGSRVKRKTLKGGKSQKGKLRGTPVAVKELIMDELTPQNVGDFLKEALICSQFNHPGITRFLGVCVAPPKIKLVFEYCELGSLTQVLLDHENIELKWLQRLRLLQQVADAMSYLHHRNIIHRDLKSDNIICHRSQSGIISAKICDFGLARKLVGPDEEFLSRSKLTAGNPLTNHCKPLSVDLSDDSRTPHGQPRGRGLKFPDVTFFDEAHNPNSNGKKKGLGPVGQTRSGPVVGRSLELSGSGPHSTRTRGKYGSRAARIRARSFKPAAMTTLIGSVRFLPPEVLKNIDFSVFIPLALHEYTNYTKPIDVFAFGCIIYETIARARIWDEKDEDIQKIVDSVLSGTIPVPESEYSEDCPEGIRKTYHDCLTRDPASRPQFDEIVYSLKNVEIEMKMTHANSFALVGDFSGDHVFEESSREEGFWSKIGMCVPSHDVEMCRPTDHFSEPGARGPRLGRGEPSVTTGTSPSVTTGRQVSSNSTDRGDRQPKASLRGTALANNSSGKLTNSGRTTSPTKGGGTNGGQNNGSGPVTTSGTSSARGTRPQNTTGPSAWRRTFSKWDERGSVTPDVPAVPYVRTATDRSNGNGNGNGRSRTPSSKTPLRGGGPTSSYTEPTAAQTGRPTKMKSRKKKKPGDASLKLAAKLTAGDEILC